MRIMTFNIRGAIYEDGLNHWRHRAALNAETISGCQPDLIGFQEAHLANLEYYEQHVPGFQFGRGTPYNNQEPYQHCAIGWNPASLRVNETGGFWLSETPEVHSGSWETNNIRSATWARCTWIATGLNFLFLNTHLDHISERARVEGARLIIQRLADLHDSMPAVVVGDFNCPPNSAAYCLFREAGFQDAYLVAGYSDPVNTFHSFQGPAYLPSPENADRIDWVLLRGWEGQGSLQGHEIVRVGQPPVFPSDHYPILADLDIIQPQGDGR